MNIQIAEGILIPFVGTSLGAAMVFFLKKEISAGLQSMIPPPMQGGISSKRWLVSSNL